MVVDGAHAAAAIDSATTLMHASGCNRTGLTFGLLGVSGLSAP
jgi:hypothetical protein